MQPELIGGRYRVQRAVGRGGMGTVWLCRDETLARDVAVKQVGLLPGESLTDRKRALREARATAALHHRNVVVLHDVVQEEDHVWLVMEYVPSRTLADVISEEGPIEPGRVAAIGAQLADGLAAAHAAGLTHRDVKPANVLIAADGTVKISDFGLSRTVDDPAVTQSGMLTGTPSYIAPEVARGADPSRAADVWALGATLYAAVEGRPPYEARENPLAVLHQIANEPPPRPRRAGTLEPVLTGMLERDPQDRWSMEHAGDVLRGMVDRPREKTRELAGPAATTVLPRPAASGSSGNAAPDRSAAPAGPAPKPEPTASPAERTSSMPAVVGPPLTHDSQPTVDDDPPRRPYVEAPDDDRERRRGSPLVLGLLALLAAVAAVGLILTFTDLGDGTEQTAGDPPAGARSRDQDATPRASDAATTSEDASPADEGGPEPDVTDETTPTQTPDTPAPEPAGSDPVDFVDRYFEIVPGDLDAGWALLSPGYQARTGRGSYTGFWATVASVDATDLVPVRGGRAVEATLIYQLKSGGTSTERHRIPLVPGPSGQLLINGDDPI